ncbi:GntR family transcriptional regulator [Rhodococcus opacus]|uniref:GntR family transcriptional regulator n=1 Tax=Rhodococcus opacus TaxID=37919 RepID=UPI0022355AF0|nr:GntR family transcriptional regulator [Rhodococcus opacus]UZG58229.1 GntR family transcriptional regulator [Rhodococcus opacus]
MTAPTSKRYPLVHHGTLGADAEHGTLYASAPMELARDARLSPMARSVAFYVWSHSNGFQISAVAIADALGVSRKPVGAALDNLQEHGWLVRQPYARPGKKQSWERWHLRLSNIPFTPEQIEELSQLVTLDTDDTVSQNDARSEETLSRNDTGGESKVPTVVSQNDAPPCVKMTHQSSASLVVDPPEVDPVPMESEVVAAEAAPEAIPEDGLPVEEESYGDPVVPEGVDREEAAREAADLTKKIFHSDPWAVSPIEQWANERPAVTTEILFPASTTPQPWETGPDWLSEAPKRSTPVPSGPDPFAA